jgi:subtilisin family serine protease/fibronectin type 3 domain-containing protein
MSIALRRIKLVTAIGLAFAIIFAQSPLQAFAVEERSNYLVIVKPGTDLQMRKAIAALGERPLDELDFVLDGFTLNLTLADANALSVDPNVLQVIPDAPVGLFGTDEPASSWGLDRIDQAQTTLDNKYNYPNSAGEGVRVYVVDTGVQLDNPEFSGRTLPGFDATGSGNVATDCHGHATHVAGTIAGTKFGVAKKTSIVSVKVLDCSGRGSITGVVSGLDWIAANHPRGTPAVVNMSIGGGNTSTLTAAVEKLNSMGILNVVAAGNDNSDACNYSPASAPSAITVGSSDIRDARSSFSNYGNCVDVFAPGSSIISARASDPNGSATMSGTSMATPHVAGLAALYLGQNPSASPAQATAAIRAGGILNGVNNALSPSGNILINNAFTRGLAAPAPNPNPVINAPDAPTGLSFVSATANSATVRWEAPQYDGGSPILNYRVLYKVNGTLYWSSIGVGGSTEATINPLNSGTVYQVKIGASNAIGSSLYSSEIKLSTQVGIPSAPESLTAIAGPTMVQLNWNPPAINPGGPITNYVVEQKQGTAWVTVATPTAATALVSGLTTGVDYSFRVFSQNSAGKSTGVASVTSRTNTTNIPAPQNVVISAPTATGATITWDAVTSPSAMAVTSYLVTATPSAGGPAVSFSTSTNSLVINSLVSNSSYAITVAAQINQVIGVSSVPVTLSTASNVPTAPQSLRVSYGTGTTYLFWNAPISTGGSTITGYVVQKKVATEWVNAYSVTSRLVQVPNLAVGQSETYRVIAKNVNGLGDPTAPVTLAGRAALPGAPTDLVASAIDANGKVTLTWRAPDLDGGAPITSYQVYLNKNSSTVWEPVASPVATSIATFAPLKGSTWKYRVAARNNVGIGAASNEVTVSSPKGAPNAPIASVVLSGTDEITLRWSAPADNGGEVITGYLIEKTIDNVWTEVTTAAADARSWVEKRGGPGLRTGYRVTAINSIGSSPASAVVNIQVPYNKADAPIGVTAVLDSTFTKVTVSWQAPVNTGGSPISTYYVQMSRDGGSTWASAGSINAAGRSLIVAAAPKGTSAKYRVVAYTLAAFGNYSPAVSVEIPSTVASAPRSLVSKVDATGKLNINWLAPADNGGSAIVGYSVERLTDGTWSVVGTPTSTTFAFEKEAPGSVVEVRVSATNAVGASSPTSLRTNFPFIQAESVQGLTSTLSSSGVSLTWSAPANTGGSPISYYLVERSVDKGVTWGIISYVRTGTSYSTSAPAKGASVKFRVSANTLFGKGAIKETDLITTALTVPSEPVITARGSNVDGSFSVTWRKPYDTGGTEITGYVIEKSVAGVWAKLAEVAPTVLTVNIARDLPGSQIGIRIFAVNSVGTSVRSSLWNYQIPALRASAPEQVAVSQSGTGLVNVSWQAPASLGGSALTQYQVQFSRDGGTTWAAYYTAPTSLSIKISGPAKGATWHYRVAAYTQGAGVSELSNVVSFMAPLTVASSVNYLNISRSSVGVTLTFRAPTDLGGYNSASYIVQRLVSGSWVNETPTLQLDGTTMTRRVVLPPKGLSTYRVIAVNPSGQSNPVQIQMAY